MRRKYKNSPIIEALCEFHFIPGQPWDLTITGLLYNEIKGDFPERKQRQIVGAEFKPTKEGVEHKVEMTPRMQFFSKDRKVLIQSGPDLLVINHLKSYPAWDDFKPMILHNLKKYQDVAKPKGLKRIALRYINRIEIPKKLIELTDYFKFYPFMPPDLPQTHNAFDVRIEIPHAKDRDRLLLRLASVSSIKDEIVVVLDLNYVMVIPEKVCFKEVQGWIEKAHTTIERVFEACITPKCRKLFKETK